MKPLKSAEQRNFTMNEEYYTNDMINEIDRKGYLFRIDENDHYRVSASIIKEVKVEYNKEYGWYENVAITEDGYKLHVIL